MNSLRRYAPPYEHDAEEARELPAMVVGITERHAALTEQAERLLRDEAPTTTDLRMYNMMLNRETIVQAGPPLFGLSDPLACFPSVNAQGRD